MIAKSKISPKSEAGISIDSGIIPYTMQGRARRGSYENSEADTVALESVSRRRSKGINPNTETVLN